MHDLREILKERTNVKSVWLNDKNEWVFSPQRGMREVSREEILTTEFAEIEQTIPEPEGIPVIVEKQKRKRKKR
jgi:hypothetical protein